MLRATAHSPTRHIAEDDPEVLTAPPRRHHPPPPHDARHAEETD
jgi:hypothetical protein